MVNIIEVDILEEEMSLDILSVGLACTKSSSRVSCQELSHQYPGQHCFDGRLTRWRSETASRGMVMGYRGSSSRMASKISSSSSPLNGD